MRYATILSSFAVLAISASAAPASFTRRAGVTCNAKYRGNFYLSALDGVSDTSNVGQRGPAISLLDGEYLSAQGDAIQFQFDECSTDGWNKDGYEYGQVKIVSQGNYKCVTASTVTDADGSHGLQLNDCSGANDDVLDRQWWYAYYHDDKPGGAYVTLNLSGNPNDDDQTYNLPAAETYDGNYVHVKSSDDAGRTLNLYDITFP